jgi:hypothetical protein
VRLAGNLRVNSRPPGEGAVGAARRERPEELASFLHTQDKINAICKEDGVPKNFTARPAGDLH